jgi:AcrR family transcriptional regulator
MCYYSGMTRKRLTREESRDQTRQRLLDAALKLIARKGLAGTSVEDIAGAAGYTRGAFYSNFGGKNDLFIELLRRDHEQATAELHELLDNDLPLEQIQSRTRQMYGQLYRDNECFMNWTEARMMAVRDTKFRAKLAALMTEKRGQIASLISYFYQRAGATPPASPDDMATGFMSLAEGVKLFMLSNPDEMTSDKAETVLTLFVDSIMELALLQGERPANR